VYVQGCAEQDFNVSTGTCSHPVWAVQPSLLPPLSIADGLQLAGAIAGLWVIGFIIRTVRKTVSPR
jgi:hypothetical protein